MPEEGLTVTFDRALALAREDREFLTWEHPMTRGAMAMILDSDLGTCALTILRDPDLPTGGLPPEMIHVAECPAPPELEYSPLPAAHRPAPAPRCRGPGSLSRRTSPMAGSLRGQCLTRNRRLAHAIIQAKTATLETMMAEGEHRAAQAAAGLEVAARARMTGELDAEIGACAPWPASTPTSAPRKSQPWRNAVTVCPVT